MVRGGPGAPSFLRKELMSNLFQDFGEPVKGQKVLLATTSYDSPDASYTFSIQRSRMALEKEGIQTAYFLLQGNCHVDDARNVVIQEFLLSDCTELVFLDADVSWQPEDLVKLCKYECSIVGGVYPFRREDSRMRGDMPIRMIEGVCEPDEDGLLEVEGLPSGFMRIQRHVLETLSKSAESFWNREDRRSKVPILFERVYDPKTEIRWGGDLNFCNKWRAKGGKVHASYEMRLGHVGKTIVKDSLGATLRRKAGLTLRHIADLVKEGKDTPETYMEAREFMDNQYTPLEDVLVLSVLMARKADGPIIETGSGLTTILMAAANPKVNVWCLEHDSLYAEQLRQNARAAGVGNIMLCHQPIKNGWYDLDDIKIPEQFSLGLNDGPPRTVGSRMRFFEAFGDRVDTIICDDADDLSYKKKLTEWTQDENREIEFIEPRAALITKQEELVMP